MNITYKNTHDFKEEQLEDLFLSVEWSSGKYPQKLKIAMQNYETVYSAWDGDRLIGLICAMDDSVMTAYVHYLLVNPAYQKCGIGKELVGYIKDKYSDYLRIVLVAYDKQIPFYEKCGFEKSDSSSPMFITTLTT